MGQAAVGSCEPEMCRASAYDAACFAPRLAADLPRAAGPGAGGEVGGSGDGVVLQACGRACVSRMPCQVVRIGRGLLEEHPGTSSLERADGGVGQEAHVAAAVTDQNTSSAGAEEPGGKDLDDEQRNLEEYLHSLVGQSPAASSGGPWSSPRSAQRRPRCVAASASSASDSLVATGTGPTERGPVACSASSSLSPGRAVPSPEELVGIVGAPPVLAVASDLPANSHVSTTSALLSDIGTEVATPSLSEPSAAWPSTGNGETQEASEVASGCPSSPLRDSPPRGRRTKKRSKQARQKDSQKDSVRTAGSAAAAASERCGAGGGGDDQQGDRQQQKQCNKLEPVELYGHALFHISAALVQSEESSDFPSPDRSAASPSRAQLAASSAAFAASAVVSTAGKQAAAVALPESLHRPQQQQQQQRKEPRPKSQAVPPLRPQAPCAPKPPQPEQPRSQSQQPPKPRPASALLPAPPAQPQGRGGVQQQGQGQVQRPKREESRKAKAKGKARAKAKANSSAAGGIRATSAMDLMRW